MLPNPSLAYSVIGRVHGTADAINGTQQQAWVEQPLLLAGQRGARRDAAEGALGVARARAETDMADLERHSYTAWVTLLAAQVRLAELERARAQVAELERIVTGRAGAGAASPYQVLRMQVEGAELATQVASARSDVDAASGNLAALLGIPGWAPRARGTLAPLGVRYTEATLWQQARKRLPELRMARREAQAAEARVGVAQAERWPVPVLGAGVFFTTAPGAISAYAALSVPFPLFDFGGAAIDRARAEARAALADADASEAAAHARLDTALRVLALRRAALESLEHGVIDRLPQLSDMARASYQAGSSGLTDLLDAVRARSDTTLTRIDAVAAVVQGEIDVLAAGGALGG